MKLSELKHQAILEQAKHEFLAKGYQAANLDHICLSAGVSKRTLYRHFDNKLELFKAVLLALHLKLQAPKSKCFNPELALEPQLMCLLSEQSALLCLDASMQSIRMLLSQCLQQPEMAKQLLSLVREQDNSFDLWLKDALKAGKLSGDIKAMSRTLKSLFNGVFLWPSLFELDTHCDNNAADISNAEICRVFLAAYGS
ncbi:MAG: TetR/AcrR family transcriptional regulator [Shewanella sp.]